MKVYQTHLIAKTTGESLLKHENGNTDDIIDVVLYADKKAGAFTKKFALTLKGSSLFDTCKNIWDFLKTELTYKVDTPGYQWIKSPGRLVSDDVGDCKSFSIMTASILQNLGIQYGYRFTSYSESNPTPTHVYVFVPLKNGKEIIIDAVWNGAFNTQKPYNHKKDKVMSKIYYLGSTESTAFHKPGTLVGLPKDYHDMAEGEFELHLARQRMEIEAKNHAAVGSPYTGRYEEGLKVINQAIANINNPDAIIGMADDMIGKAKAKGKDNKAGGLLKKIGTGIKKGVKAVSKVVTAPVRLVAKGALEIYLPTAAPAFLYLFTPPGAKLPDIMARKKAKAEKFKKFVVTKISMKDEHFMGIIRNALTKRFGKSPESYLQERLATRVSGIAGNNHTRMKFLQKQQQHVGDFASIVKTAGSFIKKVGPVLKTTSDKAQSKGLYQDATGSGGAKNILNKAAQGDLIGSVMAAITWLISKLGGKKEDVDFSKNDLPDIEADAANAFEYKDLTQDYSGLTEGQKAQVKAVATELIEKAKTEPVTVPGTNTPAADKIIKIEIDNKIEKQLPFLNEEQKKEIVEEVAEGAEPLDENEGRRLGLEIKTKGQPVNDVNMNNGGGTRGGICGC